ncbi:nitrogen fixation protein NifM [Propionivibrio limicola]|uniref:nitrogen fixation protein NifM n=1 Tax=Propionivibrio limicola TaxID=167645 RepID=UPI0012929723|nr:nitrogen fixation protein NifM [Propionivibrio limicola]
MSEVQPYLTLKLAQELFHKPPASLEPEERKRVDSVVARQVKIEQRILATPEAAQVVLPASSVEQAFAEIRARYESEDDFLADLEKSGLDQESLIASIERDLKFDAVLDRVASRAAEVSETDIEIFYHMHRDRFRRPENRTLRHILITINDTLHGSDRASARRKIDTVRTRLLKSPKRFAEQATRYSECPTAMNGGLLGAVQRGQLYPELEKAAFMLQSGEISRVIESPMGFHVMHCAAIESASETPLAAAREKIRAHLVDSRRRAAQKEWIASLFRQDAG